MSLSFSEFKNSKKTVNPHFFVIGYPIGHSLSPVMHQAALDYHGINAQYHAIQLHQYEISDFISWMNRDEFLGCNITIPYKSEFMNAVDQIDEIARHAGVINTIAKSDFQLFGHNTDVYGFLSPLRPYANDLEGERAIVFGTGGASKAVLIGLEELGLEEVVFVSRSPEQNSVASDYLWTTTVDYGRWQAYANEATLIVNTTPLGMEPNRDASPVNKTDNDLLRGKICYDLIYNPLRTHFLKQAEEAAATTINGLEMLMMQGNRSFEIWTGKSFPFDEIKALLIKNLKE